MLSNGFLEEVPGGLLVAVGGEQDVDGLSLLVDRAIEVFPLTLNLNVGLIHPPARADGVFPPFLESRLQLRGELLNPAINAGMIHVDAPLGHPFFQVPVAQWIREVPTDTGQDDVSFETVAFEVDRADSRAAIRWLVA